MLNDVDIEDHAPRVANAPRPETREQDRQDEALGPSGRSRSRAPVSREAPDAKADRNRPRPKPEPEPRQDVGDEGEAPRGGFISRHPVRAAIGAASLLLAAGAGYVYWDYASHFESTDDAFIAARQFAIAPKVSGYVTEVPVTDNQHVVAGQVIARIDDRDYRTALEQAEAQVAAAQANINNMDAQITGATGRRCAERGAGRPVAGQPRVLPATGGALRPTRPHRLWKRPERAAVGLPKTPAAGDAEDDAGGAGRG